MLWRNALPLSAVVLAYCTYFDHRVVAPPFDGRKVLFIGPGMGHVAFTLGFVGTLLADEELVDAIHAERAVFGGTSSGGMVASYAAAVLAGCGTVDDWYRALRKGYETVANRSTLAMLQELDAAARAHHGRCRVERPDWLREYLGPLSVTEVGTLRPRFFTSFDGEDDFAAAMTASSYVPGLMGLRPWLRVRGAAAFDGYLSLWRTWLPQNYLYIGFLPTLPVHRIGEHSLRAFEYDSLPGWLSKANSRRPISAQLGSSHLDLPAPLGS